MERTPWKVTPHPEVRERGELDASDVLDVAEGRALAVVVPDYYSREACGALAEKLLGEKYLWMTYPAGSGAEHIGTLGAALFNCIGEELSADCQEYFDKAPARNRALRAAAAPFVLPADRVRVDMDNQWPAGATLLRIDGRPAFYGLCRYVSGGGGIEVHTDRADWDLPCVETAKLRAQLFMNVYLAQTEFGGDLELWDCNVVNKSDYEALRHPELSFALDRTRLPEPAATIRIEPGTLVIANASRPHAVTPCGGSGQRVSVSGFLGYAGPDTPLRVFS
jgi:hypothetical protein